MGEQNHNIAEELIVLGDDADGWFKTSIGQYVLARCEEDIGKAYLKLGDVDPEDPKAIKAIQHDLGVAKAVPGWLNEVIKAGKQELEQKMAEQEGREEF